MTFDERVRALEPLRLTERQARFVVTVALHSGYCLRRQYMAFAGLRYGRVVRHFLDHLVARQLAVRERCRADRGYLYHLQARSIYRALGQEDNRNRRAASLAAIGRKLMLLDFVIAHPDAEWLATEDDKVEFFTSRLGVPLAALPRQTYAAYDERTSPSTRYFAQKLPIFVAGHPPVVHFVTLALDTSGDGFERFLRDHARLLSHVPSWAIDVVGPAESAVALAACRRVFDRHALSPQSHSLPAAADVSRHFAIRRSLEQNDVTRVSIADLNWFRESRPRFANSIMEARFARWLVDGDRALADDTIASRRPDIGVGRFVAHSLPFTYQQFGDLAGVC
jgi:hypothetical protein